MIQDGSTRLRAMHEFKINHAPCNNNLQLSLRDPRRISPTRILQRVDDKKITLCIDCVYARLRLADQKGCKLSISGNR